MTGSPDLQHHRSWRARLFTIIFEADTPGGKVFDVVLLWSILLSVVVVSLESVAAIRAEHGRLLLALEWFFTLLFTAEYVVRLLCVRKPARYASSFYGIVDLLAIIPTYLSVIFQGSQSLLVIRSLRLLRIFRVLKLTQYLGEAHVLMTALRASRRKVTVFLGTVLTVVLIMGSLMYLIEGEAHGFTSIPVSVYWAIVTMTTVGYGDIAPQSALGQMLAAALMITGYAIIAVPTGIVSIELAQASRRSTNTQSCPSCSAEGHDNDAKCCKYCGARL